MTKTFKNSIVTPSGQRAMVDCVLVKKMKQYEVAAKFNVHTQTVRKWVKRFKEEGESGFEDRLSRPYTHSNAASPEKVKEIITRRKEGKMTGYHIARELNIPQRTVSRHLNEAQLSGKKDMVPRVEDPPQLYEHEALGDMIHLDIKPLRNFHEEAGNRHR